MRTALRTAPVVLLALLVPSCVTGGFGAPEIIIIAGVLLLLFGGRKLPELMRGMGSGISEFKKGLKEGEKGDGGGKDDGKGDKPKEIPPGDAS